MFLVVRPGKQAVARQGELLLSQTLPVQHEGYVANVEFFTLALYSVNLASNVQNFSPMPAFPRQCVLAWPGCCKKFGSRLNDKEKCGS